MEISILPPFFMSTVSKDCERNLRDHGYRNPEQVLEATSHDQQHKLYLQKLKDNFEFCMHEWLKGNLSCP